MTMDMNEVTVGFIGAGMMASALIKGFQAAKLFAKPMVAHDIDPGAAERIQGLGCVYKDNNKDLVAACDVIFLAVKPNIVPKVVAEIKEALMSGSKLLISIAAGVECSQFTLEGNRTIRVMPNTPCLVNSMAAAFCAGKHATPEDMEFVGTVLNAVGTAVPCEEKLMNAVTGLSGSGPAYIFMLIEALADGGVRQGLPRATALKLAAQTVKGAAEMVLKTGTHPGVLKDQVCSPGGTTIAGVHALEDKGFRAAAIGAVAAATKRAHELSNM